MAERQSSKLQVLGSIPSGGYLRSVNLGSKRERSRAWEITRNKNLPMGKLTPEYLAISQRAANCMVKNQNDHT